MQISGREEFTYHELITFHELPVTRIQKVVIDTMSDTRTICAICAWRETCQKKFAVSGRDVRCVDYVKDLSIRDSVEEGKDKGQADPQKDK